MSIIYEALTNTISIHTRNTTYQMMIGKYNHLLHLYYGRRAEGNMDYLLTFYDRGFSGNPYEAEKDKTYSLDTLPQEYPCYGSGDYRTTAIEVSDYNGVYGCDLRYVGHKIVNGKYSIPGLPAVYEAGLEASIDKVESIDSRESESERSMQTLEITLEDAKAGVRVILYYSSVYEYDVITRAAQITNISDKRITLGKAYSANLDIISGNYDVIHFHGRHGMERVPERVPVIKGEQSWGSRRGTSSHQHNPFVILAEHNTTEDHGSCFGMSLLYSGSFNSTVEMDQMGLIRMNMGVQDDMFEYDLESNESFYTPEVALSYADGLNNLSWNYHRLVRNCICREPYKNSYRPILINNWEATYFDFTGDKIVEIAKKAAELGVEMLVLDDGWFGKRDTDHSGLGDWFVNEEKLGGTLDSVVRRINEFGMKFGIWIEPEMISEDSDLYRAHPDWAFVIPGRKPNRARYQLVLDFSRREIVDHIYSQIAGVIEKTNVEYIKMDMNRSIYDVYTATTGRQNQGKILYQYVLGVYDFIERLHTKFPELLIEGCSGGGGRFDMGMLYYTPQIWCSDNTDAIDRMAIQYGTSFGYPVSTMGAHVSAVPNHQTGREVDLITRGVVARAGTFGYELDLNKLSNEEKAIVKTQIGDCKKYWKLTHEGRYYRLTDFVKEREVAAWQFVNDDKTEALVSVVTLDNHCNCPVNYIKLRGLRETAIYYEENTRKDYSGAALMEMGMPIPVVLGEYKAFEYHFIMKGECVL